MTILIECVALCLLFTVIVAAVSLKDPLAGVHNWPPAIPQRAREMGLRGCHDKQVRIPGTEDMKEYQDYWFHIRASLKGQVIGVPVALVAGGLTEALARL